VGISVPQTSSVHRILSHSKTFCETVNKIHIYAAKKLTTNTDNNK